LYLACWMACVQMACKAVNTLALSTHFFTFHLTFAPIPLRQFNSAPHVAVIPSTVWDSGETTATFQLPRLLHLSHDRQWPGVPLTAICRHTGRTMCVWPPQGSLLAGEMCLSTTKECAGTYWHKIVTLALCCSRNGFCSQQPSWWRDCHWRGFLCANFLVFLIHTR